MPLPALGTIAAGVGSNFAAGASASVFDPILRTVVQWGNEHALTLLPDVATLLSLYGRNLISRSALDQAMQLHGAALIMPDRTPMFHHYLWGKVADSYDQVPGIGELMGAGARGLLTPSQWQAGVLRAGGKPDVWSHFFDAYVAWPAVGDLVVARNRNIISPADFDTLLMRQGFYYPAHRRLIDALREQIPPISDLLRFSHKEAMQPELANELGFYNEYPYNLEPWLAAQGMFGGPGFTVSRDGREVQATWLDLYNAAEWQPISPGQAYTMLHRIRPDNVEKFRRVGLEVKPFTTADVEKWLRIGDYPQPIRPYLIATAYATNRLVDIRNALMLGVRDAEWARGQFLDRGLHPDDAQFAVDLAVRQNEEKRAGSVRAAEKAVWGQAIAAIRAAYGSGMLDRGAAVNQLIEAGMNPAAADTAANVEDAKAFTKLVQSAVRAVRRDYLGGALTAQEADAALQVAGMQPGPRQRMLNAWSVELGHARRVASTQQVRDWYLEGLLTLEEGQRRLRNLGWGEPDVQLHLSSFALKASQARAKQAAAAQQSQRKQAADLEKLQKQLAAEQEKVRSTLRRLSPTSKLQAWYVKGIISEDFFRRRMLSMGYDEGSTNQHFEEARKKKEEADAKAAENGQAAEAPAPGA
jgi:hypothetical protein